MIMERNMVSFKIKCSHYPILFRLSLFLLLYVILFLPSLTFAFCENVSEIRSRDIHGHFYILPDSFDIYATQWRVERVISTPGLTYESNIDFGRGARMPIEDGYGLSLIQI